MSRYTLKDMAIQVIKDEGRPLSSQEIWDIAKEKEYDKKGNFIGKTPWVTISAKINIDIKENKRTKFVLINSKPKKFFLKELASEEDFKAITERELEKEDNIKEFGFTERQLHPLLTYYAYTYLNIYTKTIYHEKSSKDKYSQWLHPDIIGVSFSIDEWDERVINLSKEVGRLSIKIYSFELKKELGFHNLRESYFQAVSNSSWANEGYLVAAEISTDEEFVAELKRLTSFFGIGIIKLDIKNPDDSEIIFPAKIKNDLDWETLNKLTQQNPNVQELIQRILKDSRINEIKKDGYDKVFETEKLVSMLSKKEQ